ncbi:hypothetical protein AO935_03415 [Pseudomonas aeruginosa]|uniref:alpha/beta hydrolase family esterase n=1 Tax=Pseudomonas aeruginosa TaxID=287 RepID=UPI00071BCDAC|nr:PHB depolymerase family esterase [Pseudomonas aeruginosa]KSF26924.1 hypothetical protein AO935_03415 [Pseudomonas aeruginosa]MDC3950276.1 prolyl oligopeptidase family serine peptidase [Pseudomonas aeruginosa]
MAQSAALHPSITRLLAACLVVVLFTVEAALPPLHELKVGSATRRYLLSQQHKPARPLPLVLALHGANGDAREFAASTALDSEGRRLGFLLAFPEGSGEKGALSWNAGDCCKTASRRDVDDIAFLRALVADLVARGWADPQRVFVVGFSNGGMLAYRLAAEAPALLRAMAAVSATLDIDPNELSLGVPLLHIHGSADTLVPYRGGVGPRSSNPAPYPSVSSSIASMAGRLDARLADDGRAGRTADGKPVSRERYASAADGEAVVLLRIARGGHDWPRSDNRGRGLDATREVLRFFQEHGG